MLMAFLVFPDPQDLSTKLFPDEKENPAHQAFPEFPANVVCLAWMDPLALLVRYFQNTKFIDVDSFRLARTSRT